MVLETVEVSKHFGGVAALTNVTVNFRRGAIHGLVGENGAGKSTLLGILSGRLQPDKGQVRLNGVPVRFSSPRAASEAGIALTEQEPTVVPELSVLANIYLGRESTRFGRLAQRDQSLRCRVLMDDIGFHLDLATQAGSLSVAQQQELTILRALSRGAQFLIMDEPTSSLTTDEAEKLLRYARRLRDGGLGVIFVSHLLDQVLSLCDEVTVLRDGQLILTEPVATQTKGSLIRAMIGRELETGSFRRAVDRQKHVVLSVKGLTKVGRFSNITFDLRAGEVLGLAGLIGSGRTEVARALVGADPVDSGSVTIDGRQVVLRSPRGAFQAGIAMVPEDRRGQGLVGTMSVRHNLSLAGLQKRISRVGLIRSRLEKRLVAQTIEQLRIKTAHPDLNVMSLSGGSQQKVVFGKWIVGGSLKALIADEPTRGVDVGAKEAIYELIAELRQSGLGILLISSELDEILRLADRVLVMRNGQLAGELGGDTTKALTAEATLALAFGA